MLTSAVSHPMVPQINKPAATTQTSPAPVSPPPTSFKLLAAQASGSQPAPSAKPAAPNTAPPAPSGPQTAVTTSPANTVPPAANGQQIAATAPHPAATAVTTPACSCNGQPVQSTPIDQKAGSADDGDDDENGDNNDSAADDDGDDQAGDIGSSQDPRPVCERQTSQSNQSDCGEVADNANSGADAIATTSVVHS